VPSGALLCWWRLRNSRKTDAARARSQSALRCAPHPLRFLPVAVRRGHSKNRHVRHSSATGKTLLTCIDGLYGNQGPGPARYRGSRLDYNRLDDRLLASRMGTTRRDALKSFSRANSSDPGDLPSIGTGPGGSLPSSTPPCTEQQDFFYRGGSEWRDHRHKY
jgi:hypothetical protein